MRIDSREIGPGFPPYIIAEISCNHGGSIERAFELIDAAKATGADAVKFQCYTPDSMTIDCDRPEFMIQDGPWKGRRLYDLYRDNQTPMEWFPRLKARADRAGIAWLASVFDKRGVDLMVELDAAALKIASFEVTDIPLIQYAFDTGKPLIISNGMASWSEMDDVRRALLGVHPGKDYMWLRCTSGYPTPVEETGLQFMGGYCGISDHSIGVETPIAATALGAAIIEKHFKLFWHPETADAPFSLDEIDFADMVRHVHNTWLALHSDERRSEAPQRPLRRSLYVVQDIKRGGMFTEQNVRSIRPGGGLAPKEIGAVLGRVAQCDISRGEPLQWHLIG
jgi:pseudaminic acid synthase